MEIVYCAGCQTRVTGAEIDQGRAFRSGDRILCADCAPEELAALKPPPAGPRPDSNPRLRAPASTRRLAAVPSAPRRSPWLWIAIAGAASVVLAGLLLSGGSSRPPAPPAPEPPVAPAPRPEKAPDRSAAEWSALEKHVAEACEREEFRTAISTLEGARRGGSQSDWDRLVDRRLAEVRGRVDALFQNLKSRPRAPDLIARVSKWGLPEYSLEEKPVPPPPPPPPTPVAPSAAALVLYDDRLAPGWADWSFSTQRTWDAKDPVAEGSASLKVIFERNGAGLYLHTAAPVDLSRFAAVEFYCRSEVEAQSLFLSLSDEHKTTIASVSFSKFGGHPPVGSWKHYEVSLATLNAEGRRISGLTIQAAGKVTAQPVYFDQILLRLK